MHALTCTIVCRWWVSQWNLINCIIQESDNFFIKLGRYPLRMKKKMKKVILLGKMRKQNQKNSLNRYENHEKRSCMKCDSLLIWRRHTVVYEHLLNIYFQKISKLPWQKEIKWIALSTKLKTERVPILLTWGWTKSTHFILLFLPIIAVKWQFVKGNTFF